MMRQAVRGMVAGFPLDQLFARVVLKAELTPQSVKGGGRKKALPMPSSNLAMLRKIEVPATHGFTRACVERGTPWGDDTAWTFKRTEERADEELTAALWVVREMLFHCGCRDATELDEQLIPHNVDGRGFKDILPSGPSVTEVFQAAGLCGALPKPAVDTFGVNKGPFADAVSISTGAATDGDELDEDGDEFDDGDDGD